MELQTIVTAVDLEDDLCDAVIKTGIAMAERFGAKLHVIDAWPPLTDIGFPYAMKATIKEIKKSDAGRADRREALENRVRALEPRAITMVPVGDAPDAIATYAKNENADLLVIGSHQKGLFERMMSGGSSASIIHEAPCAVMLVTPGLAKKLTA
ncbi:MAG: universal stress protein [Pseudomonadota bacterium]